MSDTDGDGVRRLVKEYCSTHRHPSLAAFAVHGPFTRDDLARSDFWKTDNAASRPGCYVIYGASGFGRYIGKSAGRVGNRVVHHFQPARQQTERWQEGSPAIFFDIITVPEARSLEAYLQFKTGIPSPARSWPGKK